MNWITGSGSLGPGELEIWEPHTEGLAGWGRSLEDRRAGVALWGTGGMEVAHWRTGGLEAGHWRTGGLEVAH